MVTTNFGNGYDLAEAVAVEPDNKIVVAGTMNSYYFDYAVARYNANGSPDNSFGNGGKTSFNFGSGATSIAKAIATLPNGKILIAGSSDALFNSTTRDFGMVRLNANGSVDSSFDDGGKVVTDFGYNDLLKSVWVGSDGKVIAAGTQTSGPSLINTTSVKAILAKYNADGSLDVSFGTNGKVIQNINQSETYSFDLLSQMIVQPNGKLLCVGTTNMNLSGSGETAGLLLARYNADGTLDTTFNGIGYTVRTNDQGLLGSSVALQSNQKIICGGLYGNTQPNIGTYVARFGASELSDTDVKGGIENVTVWPNPFSDYIRFISDALPDNDFRFGLYDGYGRQVFSGDAGSIDSNGNINLPELASGMYVLRIVRGTQIQVVKLVK